MEKFCPKLPLFWAYCSLSDLFHQNLETWGPGHCLCEEAGGKRESCCQFGWFFIDGCGAQHQRCLPQPQRPAITYVLNQYHHLDLGTSGSCGSGATLRRPCGLLSALGSSFSSLLSLRTFAHFLKTISHNTFSAKPSKTEFG